jgi:LuxR family transcriptional regulator, maltose regulon positive regulatory protein
MVSDVKVQAPRLTDTAVLRPRLLESMAAAQDHGAQVMAVLAPAGSGKTVLLAQRAAQLAAKRQRVAWVSLDDDDNNPFALWSSILTATARACGNGDAAAVLRGMSPPSRAPNAGFVTAFTQAIDTFRGNLWLVLDDVQVIDGGPALQSLDTLLRHLPKRLSVMLGARFDPPLPIGRLVLEGRAAQIRFADLAFNRDETTEFLSRHDIRLADDDLGLLLARTEGWAAGLRLAALSLTRTDNPSDFVAGFAGDARPVADYLVSEVLSRVSDDTEEFLLKTAVPEWVNVDLARELTGRDDAGSVLDGLEHANALIQRHGDWYRYHSLLRGYLVAELTRRDGPALGLLHSKAAGWLGREGMPSPALDHAAAARDWGRLSRLVDRFGLRLLLSGQTKSLRRALGIFPAEVMADPMLALMAALVALDDGDLMAARHHLGRAGRVPDVHDSQRLQVLHATTLLYEARMSGDPDAPVGELITLSTQPVDDDPDLVLLATAERGFARVSLGDYRAAASELAAALALASRDARDVVALDCLTHLAANAADQGDFVEMHVWAQQAIAFATTHGWVNSRRLANAYTVAAWASCQMLEYDVAAANSALAATLITGDVAPEVELATTAVSVIVAFDAGLNRRDEVVRLREQWRRIDGKRIPPALVAFVCGAEQQMALRIGEAAWASDAAERAARHLGEVGDTLVLRAVMHSHAGRETAARRALAAVLTGEVPCHGVASEIIGWILAAHQADDAGEPVRAFQALTQVLDLAAPRRAKRDIVHAPAAVLRLLIRNRGRFGAHELFVEEVLAAVQVAGPGADGALPSGGALTGREMGLLRDLPSLLSLEEIARANVVSVNTVKTHLKAVYRKLGVTNRRGAVDRARELGLI